MSSFGSIQVVNWRGAPTYYTTDSLRAYPTNGFTEPAFAYIPSLGLFQWDPTSTAIDDNVSVIKPTAITGPGRWVLPDPATQVSGSGSTGDFLLALANHVHPMEHETLRQLIHFIDNGPAEGFNNTYREVTGTLYPSSIIWYDKPGVGRKKIVEKLISWGGVVPLTITWLIYNASEVLLTTITDTISYSGLYEINRIRSVS